MTYIDQLRDGLPHDCYYAIAAFLSHRIDAAAFEAGLDAAIAKAWSLNPDGPDVYDPNWATRP